MTVDDDAPALCSAKSQPHQRLLKVREAYHAYQLQQSCHDQTPMGEIPLKDHWLINATGFEIDTPIRVMEGCPVVTAE